MGIIKQGILGGFSGKVGSVVGTSWKGRAVMKAMPLSVANPRTTGQVNQRSKFSGCVALAKELLGGSIATFDNPFAGNVSGYNRFVARNVDAFNAGGALNPTNLKISEGVLGATSLKNSPSLNASRDQITLNFRSISSPYNLGSDKGYAVVISHEDNAVLSSGGIVCGTRTDETLQIPLTRALAANERVYIYRAFIREDKKYASDTNYSDIIFE